MMLIYEINGGWHVVLHAAGIALVIGRLLQTAGMWNTEVPGFARGAGQSLTWLAIAALAVMSLLKLA
jgi:uncharacterized membrane protein YecN with MAPEG domain